MSLIFILYNVKMPDVIKLKKKKVQLFGTWYNLKIFERKVKQNNNTFKAKVLL